MKKFKKILIVLGVLLSIIIVIGYFQFYKGNVKEDSVVFIPSSSTYEQVLDSLRPHLKDLSSFDFIAKRKSYPDLIKGGKYQLSKGDNNITLVNRLRSGDQAEQEVNIKSYWSVYDMAGSVSRYFEMDSLQLIDAIKERAKSKKLSEVDAYKVYIFPDTYNFYWTDSPEKFLDRMEKIYAQFWTTERDEQAKALNMSREEVDVLASIVQRETIKSDEQPKVARLYLNRLNKGMRLEADPTLVYLKQKENNYNAEIKRVYNKDMEVNSPYNTYKNKGLPPLPICIPYSGAVKSVLQPDDNEYIFMCAQPGATGYHNFAISYSDHLKNAKLYRDWADEKGIK